eukprot:scaffold127862_cov75-Phaeocystis_antarctica.AAC.1
MDSCVALRLFKVQFWSPRVMCTCMCSPGRRGKRVILARGLHSTPRRRPRDTSSLRGSTPRHARRRAGRAQLSRLEGGARARPCVSEEHSLVLLAQRGDELRGKVG